MKKTILGLFTVIIIAIIIIMVKYNEYREEYTKIKEFNLEYEKYIDKEIKGTELTTIINKAVDDNERYNIKKDNQGKYIQDDKNSVNIEIKIKDLEEEKIYNMETLYNGGMSSFVQYYGNIVFKSQEVQYNNLGKVSYIMFEQLTT